MASQLFELSQIRFLHILNLDHLTIQSGEITAIIGTSGGGKSSLLRLLNKLASPTSGTIHYLGADLQSVDSVSHRRDVAMLMQNPAVFPGSVRDNLLAGLIFQHKPLADDTQLKQILSDLQLSADLDQEAAQLSGGEKQRLAIGRLMLLDPPIWLLDEPSSALDRNTEDQLVRLITNHIRHQNKTLIMITHTPEIAWRYADRILQIESGRVASDRRVLSGQAESQQSSWTLDPAFSHPSDDTDSLSPEVEP